MVDQFHQGDDLIQSGCFFGALPDFHDFNDHVDLIGGKFKTVSQMAMIIVLIADLGGIFQVIGIVLIWVSLILTVVSLIDYVAKNIEVLTKGGM